MPTLSTLIKASLFSLTLGSLSVQAETATFDTGLAQLQLPSVSLVSNGEIQGYLSINLNVLSGANGLTTLDDAYATAVFGELKILPMVADASASFDIDTQKLTIPSLALGNTADAPSVPVTLNLLTSLDDAFVLGLSPSH